VAGSMSVASKSLDPRIATGVVPRDFGLPGIIVSTLVAPNSRGESLRRPRLRKRWILRGWRHHKGDRLQASRLKHEWMPDGQTNHSAGNHRGSKTTSPPPVIPRVQLARSLLKPPPINHDITSSPDVDPARRSSFAPCPHTHPHTLWPRSPPTRPELRRDDGPSTIRGSPDGHAAHRYTPPNTPPQASPVVPAADTCCPHTGSRTPAAANNTR